MGYRRRLLAGSRRTRIETIGVESENGGDQVYQVAEREHRSQGITSNLVLSECDKVFATPLELLLRQMGIAYHSVMLEFGVCSCQTNMAQGRQLQKRQL